MLAAILHLDLSHVEDRLVRYVNNLLLVYKDLHYSCAAPCWSHYSSTHLDAQRVAASSYFGYCQLFHAESVARL